MQIHKQSRQLPGSSSDSLLHGDRILGVLVNPRSRRNKKHLDEIIQAVSNCSKTHYRVADQPGDILKILAEFAAESVNVLAISGGDGTVSRVLTHLYAERPFEAMPVIAILRGGTANMIAGDVGSPGSVAPALQRLRLWIENGAGQIHLQSRPVLRVQPGGDQPDHYGMFFGAGAVVQGIEYTNENIHSRGLKSEFSLGLGLVRSMWGIARQDPRFIRPV
ncbi:MAG: diacylglycerol kinase family protein, partial [Gammaproteobacteria bacterium]|nr:diacylglycerol kinase family protein [Gammaproteobacteria bacterium]